MPKLTSIGMNAFESCNSLMLIELPKTVIEVEDNAFANCPSLSYVICYQNLTYLGDNILSGTDAALVITKGSKNVSLAKKTGVPYIYGGLSKGMVYAYDGKNAVLLRYNGSASSLSLPASLSGSKLVYIAENAFAGNTTLNSVTLPSGVNYIAPMAFSDCSRLEKISMPKVKDIDMGAFMGCTRLKSISADSLSQIGDYAFYGCDALSEFRISDKITNIGSQAFALSGLDVLTLPYSGSKSWNIKQMVVPEELWDSVTLNTSDAAIAEINSAGKLVQHSPGRVQLKYKSAQESGTLLTLNLLGGKPTSITAAVRKITLGAGESYAIEYDVQPAFADTTLSFKSSSSSVAAVNASGVITAKKAGSATITIKTGNGKSTTVKVSVKKAPKSIKLNADALTLAYDAATGKATGATLIASLSAGSAGKITWSSDNACVKVDDKGQLTAVATGRAVITASSHNGKKASCTVTVCPGPTKLSLSPETLKIGRGDSAVFAVGMNKGAAGSCTYTSRNAKIAGVDANGRVSAKGVGSTVIDVTAFNGVAAQLRVEVLPEPQSIRVDAKSITLGQKETRAILAELSRSDGKETTGKISYKSSKPTVVSVDEAGMLTAKKTGSAVITVSSYNRCTVKVKVTVKKAPTRITLDTTACTLGWDAAQKSGEQLKLTARYASSAYAGAYSFSSSNDKVARVDPRTGVITAQGTGTATISAHSYNGKTTAKPCTVTVRRAPETITFPEETLRLGIKESRTLQPELPAGTASALKYSASTSAAIRLSAEGKITALKAGSAQITVSCFNGTKAVLNVVVLPAPDRVIVENSALTLAPQQKLQINARAGRKDGKETAGALRYKSSKASVAAVSADGVVTGKKAGTAYIVVSAYNGVSKKIKITVKKAG